MKIENFKKEYDNLKTKGLTVKEKAIHLEKLLKDEEKHVEKNLCEFKVSI